MARLAVSSPPELGPVVLRRVVGSRVADVGCGAGLFGYMLRAAWHRTGSWSEEAVPEPDELLGIDYSELAVDLLSHGHVYDRVLHADAATLPLDTNAVDTAMSMENLEHLLPDEVPNAIAELARVARRRVVISTPAPWRVVPRPWVRSQLHHLSSEPGPMPRDEFLLRSGQVHKSVLLPRQMRRVGFHYRTFLGSPQITAGSIVYWADVPDLDLRNLGAVRGIRHDLPRAESDCSDFRPSYRRLLEGASDLGVSHRQPVRTTLGEIAKPLKLAVRPHSAEG
jgi:SAM-dependent methyltransferase